MNQCVNGWSTIPTNTAPIASTSSGVVIDDGDSNDAYSKLESKFRAPDDADRLRVRSVDQENVWFEFDGLPDSPGRCLDPLDEQPCVFAEADVKFGGSATGRHDDDEAAVLAFLLAA